MEGVVAKKMASAEALHLAIFCNTHGMPSCREVSAGQQEQAREKRPHHQSNGDIEWPIHTLKIQPRQGTHIELFGPLPQQSNHNSSWHNGQSWNTAIREYPIDEEKYEDAGNNGQNLQETMREKPIEPILCVTEEYPCQQRLLPCCECDGGHSECSNGKGKPKRHHLIM